jgi:hypothetical protein
VILVTALKSQKNGCKRDSVVRHKRLTNMRRKMKKLAHILSAKEFEDWFNSWFQNHYRIMSKLQRENMNELFGKLMEVNKQCTQSNCQMGLN